MKKTILFIVGICLGAVIMHGIDFYRYKCKEICETLEWDGKVNLQNEKVLINNKEWIFNDEQEIETKIVSGRSFGNEAIVVAQIKSVNTTKKNNGLVIEYAVSQDPKSGLPTSTTPIITTLEGKLKIYYEYKNDKWIIIELKSIDLKVN